MRTFLFALMCYFVFLSSYSFAQSEIACATQPAQGETINLSVNQGIYLTSQGDLKVLVVFARFKDVTSSHPDWPAGSNPNGYTTWIDPTMETGSTNLENFTNCFNQMSLGVLPK